MEAVNEERISFGDRLRNLFGFEHKEETEEMTAYHRHLLDSKIERYMDENFNNYIAEYGLVRELDLAKYEERYETLVSRAKWLDSFTMDADANLTKLEGRVSAMNGTAKATKKK